MGKDVLGQSGKSRRLWEAFVGVGEGSQGSSVWPQVGRGGFTFGFSGRKPTWANFG